MRNKILMTLALLLTAVGGAWADGIVCTASDLGKVLCTDGSIYKNVSAATTAGKTAVAMIAYVDETNKNGLAIALADEESKMDWSTAESTCEGKTAITGAKWCLPSEDNWIAMFKANGGNEESYTGLNNALAAAGGNDSKLQDADYWTSTPDYSDMAFCVRLNGGNAAVGLESTNYNYQVRACLAFDIAEPTIDVKWDAATKTGSFVMPAFDVEIAPIYAPVAQWAKVDNVDQLPTAIEGIYAGTTDAIVNAGTVVEGQGTAMYFATTDAEMTAENAAKAEGWLSTLPTAAGYDGAQTVYVWYYIKGADTPQGETASAENTFNDSEICAEPITVTVLSNKFDIQFNAANDNTIEAGKATVKVGETAAEVNEGKLTGVKMNSKVTVTAKDGYKFRKVEVKKGGAKPTLAATLTTAGMTVKVSFLLVGNAETVNFTSNGDGTYTKTGGTGNTATAPDWIIQLVENSGMIVFKAYPGDENENGKTAFKFNFFPSDNTYYMWAGNQARDLEPTFTSISVNDTAIAVTEAQDN